MPSAEVTNPQTWNRYTYCLNNPLKYVDPTGLVYSVLDEAQRKLFHTYAEQHNDKGKLTDEQVYGTLDESQQATYEANTYALEHTELHDKKGNDLGNALNLVKSVNEIVGENRGGDTHVRLYVTLTDNAIDTVAKSKEFSKGKDFMGIAGSGHGEYNESYRLKGIPSIQISYNPDARTRGDIEIDYRDRGLFSGEGHTQHYNSDIRQVGPETANGRPISNYQRFIDRWPGLRQWWQPKTLSNSYYEKK